MLSTLLAFISFNFRQNTNENGIIIISIYHSTWHVIDAQLIHVDYEFISILRYGNWGLEIVFGTHRIAQLGLESKCIFLRAHKRRLVSKGLFL